MASEVKTNKISPATATTLSVGDSGDTLALAVDDVTGFNVGSDAAGDVLYNDGTDYTRLAKPGTPAGEVLTFATSATAPSWVAAAGGLFSGYAIFEDQKANTVSGGTFTSGAWRTRDLNTTIANTDTTNIVLGTNQFTLLAGSYLIKWFVTACQVGLHLSSLYDVTGTAYLEYGSTEDIGGGDNKSIGSTRVTPSGSNVYEIRHNNETTKATIGFGEGASFGFVNSFVLVEIYKEA